MNDKVIGIIGGMGPEATASLYLKIIKSTKATKDQEHFHVIIDSNVKIPDRTQAILYGGESPVPEMVKSAKNLELLGVDVACIPCMTAHYYIEELQKSVSYPIMNAFVAVRKYLAEQYPQVRNIGVLATSGTIQMKLFQKNLTENNIIYPNPTSQAEKVMEAIYGPDGIKSGNLEGRPLKLLKEAGEELIERGAELLISGCTEIGLVLKSNHLSRPVIDPMEVLAGMLIKEDEVIME